MENSKSILPPDLRTRACRQCKAANMTCQSQQAELIGLTSHFVCPDCGHKVSLSTGGAMGVNLAVSIMAAAIFSFILWGSRGGYTVAEGFKTLGVFAIFTAPSWWAMVKAAQYPVTGTRESDEDINISEAADAENPVSSPNVIMRLNGMSPFKTFVWVFICAVFFLALATLIGWINFTYFDDQLFG